MRFLYVVKINGLFSNLYFCHPITGNSISLNIENLCASGFSVIEEAGKAVLIPGLLILKAELIFSTIYKIPCKLKVVHRRYINAKGLVLCGIVFIDMSAEDHTKLLGHLQQAQDKNAIACHPVDINELLKFFLKQDLYIRVNMLICLKTRLI